MFALFKFGFVFGVVWFGYVGVLILWLCISGAVACGWLFV